MTNARTFKLGPLPWLAATALFMQMLDSSVLNTALPAIANSFGENPLQLHIIIVSYLLAVAIFLPASGWACDKFGIRNSFLFAITMFTFGSLLCALSTSVLTLSVSRIIQGIGGAFLVPVGRLAVLKSTPREHFADVLSFMVLPALIGPLVGPTVGGFLVEYLSWHWIFLINIPVGAVCFIATLYLMQNTTSENPAKFDFKGFLLVDIAILSLYAVSFSQNIIGNFSNAWFIAIAIFFIVLYYFYAKHKHHAVFNLAMFKIRSFAVGICGNLFVRLVGGALPFIAPLFFQTALGFSPSKSGMMMLPMGITAMFAKTFAAPLISNMGYRKFLMSNTIFLSLLIILAGFIKFTTPLWLIITIYSFIGMANSLQFTAINTLSLIDVPDKYMSGANNLLSVILQVAISLGIALAAFLLAQTGSISFVAKQKNILLAVFNMTYIAMGIISLAGLLLFLFIPKDAGTKIKSI